MRHTIIKMSKNQKTKTKRGIKHIAREKKSWQTINPLKIRLVDFSVEISQARTIKKKVRNSVPNSPVCVPVPFI